MNSIFDYREGKMECTKDRNGNSVEYRTVEAYLGNEMVAQIVVKDVEYSTVNACVIRTKQNKNDYTLQYECNMENVAKAKHYLDTAWRDPKLRISVFGGVEGKKTAAAASLPSGDSSGFYPTPRKLAGRMFGKVDWRTVTSVLEPEAGKGDLVEALQKFIAASKYHRKNNRCSINSRLDYYGSEMHDANIDCIESDYNLRLILRGKGFRLVADDFLTFTTQKSYSLIIQNPPFSEGAEHLLKAISMQKRTGGQIVCLLNAETILNPYSNIRKELKTELERLGASIEIVRDSFKKAERKANVDVAIVYISIDKPKRESKLFNEMRKAQQVKCSDEDMFGQSLVYGDNIDQSIQHFEMEASIGRTLIEEYTSLLPYIIDSCKSFPQPLLSLEVGEIKLDKAENVDLAVNAYLNR